MQFCMPMRLNSLISKLRSIIPLLTCGACIGIPVSCVQAATNPSDTKQDEVARIVWGILSYTQWQPPQHTPHLCVVGETPFASALEHTMQAPFSMEKISYDINAISSRCDAVYFGDITDIQQQKIINVRQNRPLLTISELNSDCTRGSIFCLNLTSTPVSFKVNLDSLAQSGVHINPNVLLLGRKKKVTP